MKLSILISITCIFSLNLYAAANQYKTKSKIFIDGELVSSPVIVSMENNTSEISQVSEYRTIKLTQRVIENDKSLYKDGDVIVDYKLEITHGESKKVMASKVALDFGANGEVLSHNIETNNPGKDSEKSTFKVESEVIML